METEKRIGQALRAVRGEMSQAALAEAMVAAGHEKWSQSTVWAVERGTRPLRLSEAESLAGILDQPLAALAMSPDERNQFSLFGDLLDGAVDVTEAIGRYLRARARLLAYVQHYGLELEALLSKRTIVSASGSRIARRALTKPPREALAELVEVAVSAPDQDQEAYEMEWIRLDALSEEGPPGFGVDQET